MRHLSKVNTSHSEHVLDGPNGIHNREVLLYNVIFLVKIGEPVMYALLPHRKAMTYVHLFNILFAEAKRLNKKFDSILIMSDFEPGIAKAIALEVKLTEKCFKTF